VGKGRKERQGARNGDMGRNGEGNADSDAMEEGDGMNVQISQDYLSSLMQEPPIVPITQEEAQKIDVKDDESPPTDGVSWGIRKGDYNLLGLFGGAITIELPAGFEDVSALRQVPDHQEVFLHKDMDISFIVELLSGDADVSDEEAASYYFTDLSEVNEAESSTIAEQTVFQVNSLMPGMRAVQHTVCALSGVQKVHKIHSSASDKTLDTVRILLLVLRLPSVGTDVLLSMNTRLAENAPTGLPPLAALHNANAGMDVSLVGKAMRMAASSFAVQDWSLLG